MFAFHCYWCSRCGNKLKLSTQSHPLQPPFTTTCWGNSKRTEGDLRDIPAVLNNNIKQLSTGLHHSCATRADNNAIVCWAKVLTGDDKGQTNPPADLAAANSIVASVHAGHWWTCAVITDGTVRCAGEDERFTHTQQVADGGSDAYSAPMGSAILHKCSSLTAP